MRKPTLLLISAALALLAAVLILVNRPAPATGAAVGETPADFSVTCTDGRVFTLSAHRGKTVVLNLWATWCAPCVKELEGFDRLQRARPETVAVLALHVPPATEDVAAFAQSLGCDALAFAMAGQDLTDALGDADVLPQTIVIGPDGAVTYRQTGALSYETLASLIG